MSDVKPPAMITIKSKSKPDTDKVAINGTVDKRPEPSGFVKIHKDVTTDHSTKNGSSNKDDYRNHKTTGPYYKSNRVLMKNRSYSGEHGYTTRKYYDDVSKKRDETFDSRPIHYSNYRGGK